MTFLYPQLNASASRTLIQELLQLTPEAIIINGKHSSHAHHDAIYSATGGTRVPAERLSALMDAITVCAQTCGFPNPVSTTNRLRFDADAATILHERLNISASESSREGVWNHLSCVTLPHIVRWRFPEDKAERFLAGRRNTFERLWRRAFLLSDAKNPDDPLYLLRLLGEDEIVQLMERPQLHGRPKLAQSTARLFLEFPKGTSITRRNLFRELQKRLRRVAAAIEFDALTDTEREDVVLDLINRTHDALQAPQYASE